MVKKNHFTPDHTMNIVTTPFSTDTKPIYGAHINTGHKKNIFSGRFFFTFQNPST